MKKTILSILFILTIGIYSKAQELFNNNYTNTDGSGNWITSTMIYANNNFYLNGGYSVLLEDCQSYWSRGMFFLSIDSIGNITNKKHYSSCEKKIYEGKYNSLICVGNSLYSCGDKYYLSDSITSIFLTNLTQELDTLSFIEFVVDTTTKRAFSLCTTNDNNLIVCGQTDSTYNEMLRFPDTTYTKACLFKLTLDGEILWQKSYSFEDESDGCYSLFKKVIPTIDKGFIAIGYFDINHTKKNVIVKTDSLGNQEWARVLGSSFYDNPSFTDIIETRDSCYIVCGAYAYGEEYGGLYPYDAWILKIDNNGNTKWDRKHRDSITSGITSNDYYGYYQGVVEAENGNLFTICRTKSDLVGAYRGSKFRIRQLDYQGNRIGDKFIDSVGDQSGSLNPQSIIITPDGDLAVGGWGDIYYYDEENNWVSDQRIFLVKTDTCFQDTLLNNIISYNPKPINEFKLQCYPNPASSEFFVELPQGMDNDVLEIYSTTGSLVLQQNVGDGTNRVGIFGLEPGMYLVKIRGVNLYGKIIVN